MSCKILRFLCILLRSLAPELLTLALETLAADFNITPNVPSLYLSTFQPHTPFFLCFCWKSVALELLRSVLETLAADVNITLSSPGACSSVFLSYDREQTVSATPDSQEVLDASEHDLQHGLPERWQHLVLELTLQVLVPAHRRHGGVPAQPGGLLPVPLRRARQLRTGGAPFNLCCAQQICFWHSDSLEPEGCMILQAAVFTSLD